MKTLLRELSSYAQDIRNDWSEFDGRSLLAFVRDWRKRFEAEMLPLIRDAVEGEFMARGHGYGGLPEHVYEKFQEIVKEYESK